MTFSRFKVLRGRPGTPGAPTFSNLSFSTSTFPVSTGPGARLCTVSNKTPGAVLSVIPNDGRVVASSVADELLRGLSAWSEGAQSLTVRQTITVGVTVYTHDTVWNFTVTPVASTGFAKIWPGDDWEGLAKQGWTLASPAKTVPAPTVYDAITPRPGIRPLFSAFKRYNGNIVVGVDAGAVGGLGRVDFDYEGRVVSVFQPSWYDGTNDAGESIQLYGYFVELDHAQAMNLLPSGVTLGEAHMFATAYALNGNIASATIGLKNGGTDGMPFYPTSRPLVDEWVNVAKTVGYSHPTFGPAAFTGPDCIAAAFDYIADGYLPFKTEGNELGAPCKGIRIIEERPVTSGKREGYRLGRAAKAKAMSKQKWWLPITAATGVQAKLGDDTLIYSIPGHDMIEFRGRNLLLDFVAMSYQVAGVILANTNPGRGGIRFNCVNTTYGPALNPNPNDPSGVPATGAGQSVLYGGRQAGYYLAPNSSTNTYYNHEYQNANQHANAGIANAALVLGCKIDGVSGSCFQDNMCALHDNYARDIGGLNTGLRSHRPAIRLTYSGDKTYRWIEKTSTNSASSAPGTFYVNPAATFYPTSGTKTYPFVALYVGGDTTLRGVEGGFGAKASITVTDGKITAISISDPGIKWTMGETASPVLSATKGQFSYEDPVGSNIYHPGWVDAVTSDIVFTFGSNLNVYESNTNDVNVAIAAGPTKRMLLQEQSFSLFELANRINAQWGPTWTAYCDPAWSDTYRYDAPMLSHATSTNAGGIDNGLAGSNKRPLNISGSNVTQLTGIMDIHSDNRVWTANAFNVTERFTTCVDFTVTAFFSAGGASHKNGFVSRNCISVSRDTPGNPQNGYIQTREYMVLTETQTWYSPNGSVGAYPAFGTNYNSKTPAAGQPRTCAYRFILTDDWSWAVPRDDDTLVEALVILRKDTSRATYAGATDGSSKGLSLNVNGVTGGGDGGVTAYRDPLGQIDSTHWVNDMRPILDGPLKFTTGPYAGYYVGAQVPAELYTAGNRGWNLDVPAAPPVIGAGGALDFSQAIHSGLIALVF